MRSVSGAAGSGSIPDGCISPSIIYVYSNLNQRLLFGHKNASAFKHQSFANNSLNRHSCN